MRRFAATLAVLGLELVSGASPGADDPPPLAPPALSGPVSEPPGELPRVVESTPLPPGNAPVLVLPGLTSTRPPARKPATAPRPGVAENLPALVGPAEMPSPVSGLDRAPGRPEAGGGPPPLTLESVPADSNDPAGDAPARAEPGPRTTPAPARRPPGMFGRFLPGGRGAVGSRDPVTVEPRTDPAADAALKRRVERQIREGVGPRLRSYEVRVVGREVVIQARPSRFLQRRSVRHALETLPALQGYNARVNLLD